MTVNGLTRHILSGGVAPQDSPRVYVCVCVYLLQDMCFWNTSKYKIYENQPVTMIGAFGPEAYGYVCPEFRVVRYELLNGKCLSRTYIPAYCCASTFGCDVIYQYLPRLSQHTYDFRISRYNRRQFERQNSFAPENSPDAKRETKKIVKNLF